MEVGEIWAYRERVSDTSSPLIPAEIVQFGPPKTQKARVRWKGGTYPGLDEWVTKRRMLVLWDRAEAWLTDERLYALARQASVDIDPLEYRAAWEVLYMFPMDDGILLDDMEARNGSLVDVTGPEAVCRALDIDLRELLNVPFAFVNMDGHYIAPWPGARRLALRVAESYTDLVLDRVAIRPSRGRPAAPGSLDPPRAPRQGVQQRAARRQRTKNQRREGSIAFRPMNPVTRRMAGAAQTWPSVESDQLGDSSNKP